jgi:hypothetical protein
MKFIDDFHVHSNKSGCDPANSGRVTPTSLGWEFNFVGQSGDSPTYLIS